MRTEDATPYTSSPEIDASARNADAERARHIGSFEHDLKHGGYNLRWKNMKDMETWKLAEENKNCIQFSRSKSKGPGPGMESIWSWKYSYVCARAETGGKKKYMKKHNWSRAIPSKKTGCTCRLTIKTYPNTDEVLGLYNAEHSHDIGDANSRFTRLHKEVRQEIEHLLRLGVEPTKVLEQIQGKIYTEENLTGLKEEGSRRSHFCTRADVRRIQKMIEQETIRLATQDGPSVMQWVERLRERGHYVEIKTSSDQPPDVSNLEKDVFVLIIQTQYQRECWREHGSRFAGIDATHNTTHYENMSLFTLLVRDRWGHGMPAAWMVSSNGTEDTINFFLHSIRTQNPTINPEYFMSDKDHAQLNAIRRQYPKAFILLCWWHILHAWQQHFSITAYPVLWNLLKRWIRITDLTEFWAHWENIKKEAPQSLIEYFQTNWLSNIELWSAVYRKDRNVFQLCDTNMLVEAWHHLLKGTFMQGKRNRRLDQLIYTLVEIAIPHYIHKHRRQAFGYEGPDLEVKKMLEIEAAGRTLDPELIKTTDEADIYSVQSFSKPGTEHRVDLDAYDCTCATFSVISYCKHIYAVQLKFPEIYKPVSTSALDIHCDRSIEPEDKSDSSTDSEDDEVTSTSTGDDEMNLIIQKLSSLTVALHATRPSISENLKALHSHVDILLSEVAHREDSLPPAVKVAPNQHSWTETAQVMNVAVKGKRKRLHTDAYSGGERSGKKAHPDALLPRPTPDVKVPLHGIECASAVFPIPTQSALPTAVSQPMPSVYSHLAAPFSINTPSTSPSVQPLASLNTIPNAVPSVLPSNSQKQTVSAGTDENRQPAISIGNRAVLEKLPRKDLYPICWSHALSAGVNEDTKDFKFYYNRRVTTRRATRKTIGHDEDRAGLQSGSFWASLPTWERHVRPAQSRQLVPRELTTPELNRYIQWYAQAAKNAMEAGFDGVEVHCANGYLLDQFLQDVSNQRTDEYGGSVEARSKIPLQVIDAIVQAIGEERTGLRISPFNSFQGMKMQDPVPQFTHFIKSLVTAHPNLAYLHTVEPDNGVATESSDFLREIWAPRPLIACGGFRSAGSFTMQSAIERAERTGDLIAFGRWYISNPDLPTRIEKNIPLTPFNRKTFYTPAHVEGTEIGYIDYPFADSTAEQSNQHSSSNAHL